MKGKLLLLVVLAVGLFSCRKDKYDFSEKTNYSCVPRTCEAITARNFERYIVPKKNESSKDIFQEKAWREKVFPHLTILSELTLDQGS